MNKRKRGYGFEYVGSAKNKQTNKNTCFVEKESHK